MNTTDQSRLEKLAIAFATMQGHTPAEAASFAEFVDAACVQLGVNKADYERELAKARGYRLTADIKSYGTPLPMPSWLEQFIDSPSAESAKIGAELVVDSLDGGPDSEPTEAPVRDRFADVPPMTAAQLDAFVSCTAEFTRDVGERMAKLPAVTEPFREWVGSRVAEPEVEHLGGSSLTILDMIAEWRNGCSCAEPGHPEQCEACTVGLIEAIERKSKAMGAGDE